MSALVLLSLLCHVSADLASGCWRGDPQCGPGCDPQQACVDDSSGYCGQLDGGDSYTCSSDLNVSTILQVADFVQGWNKLQHKN